MMHVCKNRHAHRSLQWLSGYLEDKIFGTFSEVTRTSRTLRYNSMNADDIEFFLNNFTIF